MPIEPSAEPPRAARARLEEDGDQAKPLLAVWELTMKCDQACAHCGTRAAKARPSELDTAELLAVGDSLARLGCREVVLIGGEAYLRDDILEVVRHLAGLGLRVLMQSGGRTLTREMAVALREAGMVGIGVSVDGLASVHDKLRGNLGSHRAALRALDIARDAGMVITANTQINKLNHLQLRELADQIIAKGIQSWQVQLTVAMGRAADRPEWIIDPDDVIQIIDTLAAIQLEQAQKHTDGIPFNIVCGNNLGYYGPHEAVLRSRPGGQLSHWGGCQAGVSLIGIESDGKIKACPSLPSAPYVADKNVRDVSLEDIWATDAKVRFSRDRDESELWGHCKTCYYADTCRAGCSWTAHCTLGRRGNYPFCYHRVTQLRRKGIRERLVPVDQAPGLPYDFGRFELVEEPIDGA